MGDHIIKVICLYISEVAVKKIQTLYSLFHMNLFYKMDIYTDLSENTLYPHFGSQAMQKKKKKEFMLDSHGYMSLKISLCPIDRMLITVFVPAHLHRPNPSHNY